MTTRNAHRVIGIAISAALIIAAIWVMVAVHVLASQSSVRSECMKWSSSGCSLEVFYDPDSQRCWYSPHGPAWQAPPADVQLGCWDLANP